MIIIKAEVIIMDVNEEETELNHWFSNNKDKKVFQVLQKPHPELPNTYLLTIIYDD